ncbi:zinc ribbon domain-containing protein [Lactobacillus sp. PV034]|uniref:zinc ribbon domain-containing protein n=1 Tax=Lactobacillus sp. PV034 TaxID=2594495 RepID=UPI00223F64B9|nr:zinc ribbon domain-containing protein [Lactobacillus sp. PV034]
MKKFCPNCGKPVKDSDNVCGNCGYQLKKKEINSSPVNKFETKDNSNLSSNNTVPPTRANFKVKKPNNKKIMWICGGVLAVVIIGGGIFAGHQYLNNKNAEVKTVQSKKPTTKKATPSTKKQTQNTHQTSSEYSNDEWMMMGYIAYKAKDSDSASAIDEVKDYFKDGELTAQKNSSNSYTLSNEYGSVDVDVKKDEVVVSNDGTTTFSKDSLKNTFGDDMSIIKSLIKNISSSKSTDADDNDSDAGHWKSGIPADIVGEYSDEDLPRTQEPTDVYSFRPDHLTYWTSGMPTNFASNIKYKKLGADKYKLKFDVIMTGGPLPENSPKLQNGEPYQESTETITFEKVGELYNINGTKVEKVSSTKFTLPVSPGER